MYWLRDALLLITIGTYVPWTLKLRHKKLVQILNSKDIDNSETSIVWQLYWNRTAKIRVDYHLFLRETFGFD